MAAAETAAQATADPAPASERAAAGKESRELSEKELQRSIASLETATERRCHGDMGRGRVAWTYSFRKGGMSWG